MVVRSSTFQRPGTAKLSRRSAPHNSLKHRGSLTHNHSSVSIWKVRQASRQWRQPAQAHQRQEAMREEMKRLQSDCRNPEHVWKSEGLDKVYYSANMPWRNCKRLSFGSKTNRICHLVRLHPSWVTSQSETRSQSEASAALLFTIFNYICLPHKGKLLKLENLAISSLCVAGMREDFSYASWVGERTPPTTLRLKRMLHDVTWCFQIPTLLPGTAFLK